MEEIKVLVNNENDNTSYHNLQQTTIAVISVKFMVTQVYIKEEKSLKLTTQIFKIQKSQQH